MRSTPRHIYACAADTKNYTQGIGGHAIYVVKVGISAPMEAIIECLDEPKRRVAVYECAPGFAIDRETGSPSISWYPTWDIDQFGGLCSVPWPAPIKQKAAAANENEDDDPADTRNAGQRKSNDIPPGSLVKVVQYPKCLIPEGGSSAIPSFQLVEGPRQLDDPNGDLLAPYAADNEPDGQILTVVQEGCDDFIDRELEKNKKAFDKLRTKRQAERGGKRKPVTKEPAAGNTVKGKKGAGVKKGVQNAGKKTTRKGPTKTPPEDVPNPQRTTSSAQKRAKALLADATKRQRRVARVPVLCNEGANLNRQVEPVDEQDDIEEQEPPHGPCTHSKCPCVRTIEVEVIPELTAATVKMTVHTIMEDAGIQHDRTSGQIKRHLYKTEEENKVQNAALSLLGDRLESIFSDKNQELEGNMEKQNELLNEHKNLLAQLRAALGTGEFRDLSIRPPLAQAPADGDRFADPQDASTPLHRRFQYG